jgi:hypothetical protein
MIHGLRCLDIDNLWVSKVASITQNSSMAMIISLLMVSFEHMTLILCGVLKRLKTCERLWGSMRILNVYLSVLISLSLILN